eukprot:1495134-Pyramimonas_sp.AAC.1
MPPTCAGEKHAANAARARINAARPQHRDPPVHGHVLVRRRFERVGHHPKGLYLDGKSEYASCSCHARGCQTSLSSPIGVGQPQLAHPGQAVAPLQCWARRRMPPLESAGCCNRQRATARSLTA